MYLDYSMWLVNKENTTSSNISSFMMEVFWRESPGSFQGPAL